MALDHVPNDIIYSGLAPLLGRSDLTTLSTACKRLRSLCIGLLVQDLDSATASFQKFLTAFAQNPNAFTEIRSIALHFRLRHGPSVIESLCRMVGAAAPNLTRLTLKDISTMVGPQIVSILQSIGGQGSSLTNLQLGMESFSWVDAGLDLATAICGLHSLTSLGITFNLEKREPRTEVTSFWGTMIQDFPGSTLHHLKIQDFDNSACSEMPLRFAVRQKRLLSLLLDFRMDFKQIEFRELLEELRAIEPLRKLEIGQYSTVLQHGIRPQHLKELKCHFNIYDSQDNLCLPNVLDRGVWNSLTDLTVWSGYLKADIAADLFLFLGPQFALKSFRLDASIHFDYDGYDVPSGFSADDWNRMGEREKEQFHCCRYTRIKDILDGLSSPNTNLRLLRIEQFAYFPDALLSLANVLSRCTALESLSLRKARLFDEWEHEEELFDCLTSITGLRSIQLHIEAFSSSSVHPAMRYFASAINNNAWPHLEEITLDYLGNHTANIFDEVVANHPNLRTMTNYYSTFPLTFLTRNPQLRISVLKVHGSWYGFNSTYLNGLEEWASHNEHLRRIEFYGSNVCEKMISVLEALVDRPANLPRLEIAVLWPTLTSYMNSPEITAKLLRFARLFEFVDLETMTVDPRESVRSMSAATSRRRELFP
ncbi:hypothetical protein HDU67_002867 [Dinochytrium kinnereticum]|nr:hypothetical protein HDU67_002867 [Dinochytrium kinnereticum]